MITTIIDLEAFLDANRRGGEITLTLDVTKKGISAVLLSRDWTSKKQAPDLGMLFHKLEAAALVTEFESITIGTFHTIGHMAALIDRLRQGRECIFQIHKDKKGASIRVDTNGWFGEVNNPASLDQCYTALAEKGPMAVDVHIQKAEAAGRAETIQKSESEGALNTFNPGPDMEVANYTPAPDGPEKPHLTYIAGQDAQEGVKNNAPNL